MFASSRRALRPFRITAPAALVGRLAAGLALLAALAPLRAARAQGDGFLFGAPRATLTLRGGFDHARAGSDLFTEAARQLTLSRGSFSGGTVAGDLGVRLSPRFDAVLGVGYSGSSADSHFRHFVDNANGEIQQTTSFRRVPITASLKGYLTPRGRSIGSLVWIPARVTPFAGAGGGMMYYRFSQVGSFVDFKTNDVFDDELTTSSWTPTAHGFVGLDYTLSPRVALTGEARYTWARGAVVGPFQGYDRADLSGVALTAGVSFRF